MKHSNYTIGNRTRDLPACSKVPPRTPKVNRLLPLYSGYKHSNSTLKMITKGSLETLVTIYKSIRCHNLGNYIGGLFECGTVLKSERNMQQAI